MKLSQVEVVGFAVLLPYCGGATRSLVPYGWRDRLWHLLEIARTCTHTHTHRERERESTRKLSTQRVSRRSHSFVAMLFGIPLSLLLYHWNLDASQPSGSCDPRCLCSARLRPGSASAQVCSPCLRAAPQSRPISPKSDIWLHAHEVHACEMHAYEVHAHEVHAHEVYAHEVYVYEVHAREVHAVDGAKP
jgi:hypothetical protein